jgi:hypothetical protein
MSVQKVKDTGTGELAVVGAASQNTEADSAHTIPAANLIAGFGKIVPTAARALTLDTAANLDAAQPWAKVGDVFEYVIANNSAGANAVTFVTNTGLTLVNTTASVGQNKVGRVTFVKTGAATYDVYTSASA